MRDWLILAALLLIVGVTVYLLGLGVDALRSLIVGGANIVEAVNTPKP